MKKLIVGLAVAALLPLSAPVMAKTVCLSFYSGNGQMKITVKPLKKPGTYSPIVGIYREAGNLAAVEGSAMVNADGTISLGFQVHSMAPAGQELMMSAVGLDTKLQGIYSIDYAGDGDYEFLNSTSFTAISCKDFVLAPL